MGGHINPDLDESSDSYQIFLADLRGKLQTALRSGRTYEQIADGTFVAPKTIQNFNEGKTRRPSSWTVERLSLALGYRLALVPIDDQGQGSKSATSK
jgi:hypothetical protein